MTKNNYSITINSKQDGGRNYSRNLLETKDGALKCLKGAYLAACAIYRHPYVELRDHRGVVERMG